MSSAPKLDAFLAAARYFIGVTEAPGLPNQFPAGSRGNELFSVYGYTSPTPWCAIFVSVCAIRAGVSGIIIAKDSYARGICEKTRNVFGGMWLRGPASGGSSNRLPQSGDLILFQSLSGDNHVGIVEYVEGNTIHTIEGNTSDSCARRTYAPSYERIYAYVRPNWRAVGDDVTGYIPNYDDSEPGNVDSVEDGVAMPLYTTRNTRHDMTMREIAYFDNNYHITEHPNHIRVGVINYTSMLGAFYEILAPTSYSDGGVDTSGLSGNLRVGFDYLLTKGFNAAACCAICANIDQESGWNPASHGWDVNDWSSGLCQWHANRRTAMVNRVPDWRTNISGQLDYLVDELQTPGYRNVYDCLMGLSNDVNGAKIGADRFVRRFEVPADVDLRSRERQAIAANIFNRLNFTSASNTVDSVVHTQSGATNPPIARTIEVPNSITQSGLIRDYTNYGYWYSRWNRSSTQYRLAQLWNDKGRTYDRNIATIDGCYLIAMTTTFGTVGDIITLELADGTSINCIMGDAKGADAGNMWGHRKSNGISLVEWETYNPNYTNSATIPQDGDAGIQLGSWAGQHILRAQNRGTYLR